MTIKAAIIAAVVISALTGCGNSDQEIRDCVARGVAYFKEMGTYPVLTSKQYAGRRVEDEALTRCKRTTTAF